ncbi:uncharacterized protein K452DRAFT_5121 [Aplosporella prunicola CBS 121167]|uniref:Major facilitator superfamily (MFS) profile domain-containing protein n=1 Tax=Aplosporella prunicola CBS 121167 TaxID=1176127 RepID=A0A6A6BWM8_9PEZI|nr:uncharacterized protein K452DRAFT_5121 [Aplosporella prunicola CBS 121167]KAF2147307.1 hypothetical protein K452DRAFT_5121 [Aplosporella prunicola CBS 121167]
MSVHTNTNNTDIEKPPLPPTTPPPPPTPTLGTVTTTTNQAPPTQQHQLLAHSHDADAALAAITAAQADNPNAAVSAGAELDAPTQRRLLRRIDARLMPLLCVVYGLNYLDKTTLSYASIMGIKADLDLSGDEYSWLGSVFYFGYLVWEYPTNRLLQRLPLGKYSAFNILAWGIVLTSFASVTSFAGALIVRFFLGVFEAAVTPGFALCTSQWYTRSEQGTRTGIWFSFNGAAQIVGGLLAYGIARGAAAHGAAIAPWKIIFLATGLLTTATGAVFLFVVPDSPLNARWLAPADRVNVLLRIRGNQQGVGNPHWKAYQVREALLDPLTWAFFAYALVADIPNGGLTNFFSMLISSFGYTPEQSLLLGCPAGAFEIVALLLAGWLGDRFGNRLLISTSGLLFSIFGMALVVGLPESMNVGRLVGYYLTQTSPTPFVALLSLISTNVAGYTKKTTVAALFLIGYCAGNIIGPQTFRGDNYVPAEITILVCYAVGLGIILFIYAYCKHMNRKKAAIRAQPHYVKLENQEWLDLTDRENPEFVYTL